MPLRVVETLLPQLILIASDDVALLSINSSLLLDSLDNVF